MIANVTGTEAIRLRSDILWAAKRWMEAAEQIELLYGDRWSDWQPLTEPERADVLRAGLGYALGEDRLGLDRLRGKYAAKMAESPDRRAFEVVTSPSTASSADFREVARAIAATDTLDGFLRDMRARYPETGSFAPASPANGTPEPGSPQTRATTPERRAGRPDPVVTGSIAPRSAYKPRIARDTALPKDRAGRTLTPR